MSTEEQLGRTLHERADGVDDQPLTLADVRGRARQIRRRQASGFAIGVALVAAVALPVALLGGAGSDKSEPSPAPSPTRAVDPNDQGVPTLQDGVIVYHDGPRIPLRLRSNAQVLGFTPLGTERYVVSTLEDDGTQIALLDEVGNGVDHLPTDGGAIAVAADRSAVAWVDPDGRVQLLVAGDDEPQSLAHVPGPRAVPVAITGDCAAMCEVVGRSDDPRGGLGRSWAASTNGGIRDLPAAVPTVVDASTDGSLLAGLDSIATEDNHICGGVYDVAADDYAWRSCEHNVYDFSPDGALVATSFGEGRGPSRIDIRDARSGEAVAGATGGWISSWAWEDSTHLLAVQVRDDGATSLLRISADDATTVLDGFTTSSDDLSPPIILPFT